MAVAKGMDQNRSRRLLHSVRQVPMGCTASPNPRMHTIYQHLKDHKGVILNGHIPLCEEVGGRYVCERMHIHVHVCVYMCMRVNVCVHTNVEARGQSVWLPHFLSHLGF